MTSYEHKIHSSLQQLKPPMQGKKEETIIQENLITCDSVKYGVTPAFKELQLGRDVRRQT